MFRIVVGLQFEFMRALQQMTNLRRRTKSWLSLGEGQQLRVAAPAVDGLNPAWV